MFTRSQLISDWSHFMPVLRTNARIHFVSSSIWIHIECDLMVFWAYVMCARQLQQSPRCIGANVHNIVARSFHSHMLICTSFRREKNEIEKKQHSSRAFHSKSHLNTETRYRLPSGDHCVQMRIWICICNKCQKKILLWPYWLYYYVVCRHFEEFVYSQILHSKAPQWAADFGPNNTRKNYHNDHLLPWFRIKSLIKYYFVTCICRLHALLYGKFVNEN